MAAKYVTRDGFPVGTEAHLRLAGALHGWRTERDGYGGFVLRGEDGIDPLHHPDPVVRIRSNRLASQAPRLYELVLALIYRLRTMSDGWHRDEVLEGAAWATLYECEPLATEMESLNEQEAQYQLDLREAA